VGRGKPLSDVEAALGRAIRPDDDFRAIIGMDFEEAWTIYLDPGFDPSRFAEPPRTRATGIDYQEGDMLLSTTWGQEPSYNDMCPEDNCFWPDYDYFNERTCVGCVATAGAQICRYYSWPPTGTGSGYDHAYDWPNMPEMFQYISAQGAFNARAEGSWVSATQDNFDAVALISRKVGVGVNMNYGCYGSAAWTDDLAWVMPGYFRYYDNASVVYRPDHSYSEYIQRLVVQFELNQPVAYETPGHAIVADGYDEVTGSYYIHIVYGHNGSSNDGWWGIGSIPGGGSTDDHYFVGSLVPENFVYEEASGYYGVPTYPYRYFSRDLHVHDLDLEFAPGHTLQVLRPGLLIETQDTGSGTTLQFHGTPGLETVFYQEGDPASKTRIRISDAMMKFHEGGQIVIH